MSCNEGSSAVASTVRTQNSQKRSVTRYVFRAVVIAYLVMLVAWPISLVVRHAFEGGFEPLQRILTDPDVTHALVLTIQIALIAVAINTVFGVLMSIMLVRYDFRGKRILSALLDLPLAISPVVVGLALILVFNNQSGWFGTILSDLGINVIFSVPGMVLATCFISLPLVIRELVPVLEEIGVDQERAAQTLGASAWQTFWRITLPGIRWALVYGVVLTLARALGEFGAVKIVSGNVLGRTRTAALVVEEKYLNFDQSGAYATAFLLVLVSVACIVVVSFLRPSEENK